MTEGLYWKLYSLWQAAVCLCALGSRKSDWGPPQFRENLIYPRKYPPNIFQKVILMVAAWRQCPPDSDLTESLESSYHLASGLGCPRDIGSTLGLLEYLAWYSTKLALFHCFQGLRGRKGQKKNITRFRKGLNSQVLASQEGHKSPESGNERSYCTTFRVLPPAHGCGPRMCVSANGRAGIHFPLE